MTPEIINLNHQIFSFMSDYQSEDEVLEKLTDLFNRGASPNTQTEVGSTPPLMFAATQGKLKIVKLLISQNALVNKTNIYGNTAFMAACKSGHLEVAKYLVSMGADVQAVNRYKDNALSCVFNDLRLKSQKKIVEFLIFFCGVNWPIAAPNPAPPEVLELIKMKNEKLDLNSQIPNSLIDSQNFKI